MRQNNSYEFDFLGSEHNVYLFTVQQGITYEVIFKPSGYLFDNAQPFVDSVFEMVLLPINADVDKVKPLDTRIQPTVVAIIRHFFVYKEKVLLYV